MCADNLSLQNRQRRRGGDEDGGSFREIEGKLEGLSLPCGSQKLDHQGLKWPKLEQRCVNDEQGRRNPSREKLMVTGGPSWA